MVVLFSKTSFKKVSIFDGDFFCMTEKKNFSYKGCKMVMGVLVFRDALILMEKVFVTSKLVESTNTLT